ncbi:rhomboid family intramembrane serine protease [Aphanothece sacrum]|uniref:Membrane protein n=1 Tax=Aphanothece sacrum FPU1 TaxID=1920663 RepID=A0A401ID32_APHSA|nr:rhomboid family intramembrane serine protease [Aphanothece sacrum]GBF79151.1 membrane protein [Aphanothece sacrum FPU1]GBF86540.1 membrane protein [Aphanothece sacrum FPU3]
MLKPSEIKALLPDKKFIPIKPKIKSITQFLIGLNIIFFLLEIKLGGSENIDVLYELGALVPEAVYQGEIWRLITANFLHYGWLHLLVNMLGLYLFGNFVELIIGIYRYLMIYFISGIGAMTIFTFLALIYNQLDYILVGASASIMGLLGTMTTIFFKQWKRYKSPMATKRLQFIISIIFLQFVSDFLVPQVSILSHLCGFLMGLIVSFLML